MVKRLLSRVKLLPQILMLGIIITVGFSSVLVYVYFRVQESMWEAKRVQSRNLVEAAYDIVDRYAVMAQEGTMGLAEAQAAAIDTIRPLRYEDDDYFWINDMEPRMVMQPTNTALEGEDLSDYEDPTGFRLFNEMVRVTRERGSGFVDYQWPKPGFDRPVPKVSYVQRHPGWDWVIGTGVYVDDVQADLAAMRWVMIIVGAAVAGLAVLFSFVLARSISQPMETLVQGAESLAEGDANVTGLDQAEREQIVARRDELGEIGRAFDGLVSYFRSKAEVAEAIAQGNLTVDVPLASDQDVLGAAMLEMKTSFLAMAESVNGLIDAAVAGKLDTRADVSEFEGEYRAIVDGVNRTLDAVIGPLNVAAEYVDRISKGDTPEQITDEYNGDFNEIKNNLNQLIEAENMVVEAAKKLAVGNTDVVLEARSGSDELVHSVIAVAENAQHDADALQTMARGDLDFEINVMSEDDVLAKSIVVLQQTLGTLVEDMKLLAEAAREGRLDTRADASRHQGEFAAMVGGVNDTLDAVIGPLNVAAEYVDRISKGDIPEKITDEYNGDFNEIKNNLNVCIDTIEGLVDEMNVLTEAAVEGRLEVRGNVDGFGGDFGAIVQGANDTVDSLVGFLDAVPAPFMVIDRDFNVRYLNQTGADVVGQTQESTRGTKCYSLFNTGDCQSERCALGRAMREKTLAGSETQARVNGSVLDISYDGVPLLGLDGEVIGAMEVVTDQTAIKRAARQTQRIAEFQQQEVEKLQESLNALADGDLRRAYEVADADEETAETREAFAAIAAAFNRSVEGLRKMAGQMKEGAMNISSATSEILASSSQMASTTREQASAVTEVTSTVQEIQSSAEQVAQRAQGVAESAEQAARAAQDGSLAADEAIAAMGDIRQRVDAIAENILSLSEQTQQIGEIIDTVTDIADQSNILALNAAIEAAQAGEAGKGFRVVADEVRSLAEQSRQAAAQVKVILGDIQEASNRAVMATEQGTKQVAVGSDQVERTAQTIRELAATVEQSSQASEQIVVGVQQQTVGLDQIAVGMADINQASQQASAGAEQSENAARDLDTLGIDLERTVEQYKM